MRSVLSATGARERTASRALGTGARRRPSRHSATARVFFRGRFAEFLARQAARLVNPSARVR